MRGSMSCAVMRMRSPSLRTLFDDSSGEFPADSRRSSSNLNSFETSPRSPRGGPGRAGRSRDHLFGQVVAEVFLRRILANIGERQDDEARRADFTQRAGTAWGAH